MPQPAYDADEEGRGRSEGRASLKVAGRKRGEGHLVEEEDAGLGEDGARDGHALLLAAAQADAALAHLGVEPLGKRLDELKRIRQLCSLLHLPPTTNSFTILLFTSFYFRRNKKRLHLLCIERPQEKNLIRIPNLLHMF